MIGSKASKKKQRNHFLHFKYTGIFLKLNSRADNSIVGGPIWPKFELVLDIIHLLVTNRAKAGKYHINPVDPDLQYNVGK